VEFFPTSSLSVIPKGRYCIEKAMKDEGCVVLNLNIRIGLFIKLIEPRD
jgi:hypothetical protein